MKTKIYNLSILTTALLLLSLLSGRLNAQSPAWMQRSNFTGGARSGAVGFSIGSKGYIGLGTNASFTSALGDLWEYDPVMDVWSQKANFSGTARSNAVGFGIGTKGYVGTGFDNSTVTTDFYEYDPSLNTWTSKSGFPGTGRTLATGFSVGSKGYVGLGADQSAATFYSDFYEYDPVSDLWTSKATFTADARYGAYAFSIGTKGYVGGGYDNSAASDASDFYEYDPSADTWTQKANCPVAVEQAPAFALNGLGYVATGVSNTTLSTSYVNSFYEYDPSTDTWTTQASFSGPARFTGVGFSIGSRGYVASGLDANFSPLGDVWEFQKCAPGLTISASSAFICGSGTVALTASGASTYSWTGGITNGVAFTPTVTGSYVVTGANTGTCPGESFKIITIPVSAAINSVSLILGTGSICASGSTTIQTSMSDAGINYYLRNNSSSAVVDGPVTGNGSALSFNTGTITSTTTYNVVARELTGGLSFDGTDDYISTIIDADMDAMPVTTWEAWVYPTDDGSSDWRMIFSMEDGGWDRFVAVRNGYFEMGYSNGGWDAVVADLNQWQHIAVVYSGSDIKFYKNGVEYDFGASEGAHTSNGRFTIGANEFGTQTFMGTLDEVRVWNTLRTQTQIQADMNACLTGNESGLAGYYKFENGANSPIATDATPNGFTGTLMNMDIANDWVSGVENCGCTLQMPDLPVVVVNAVPTLSVNDYTICSGNSVTIVPGGATSYTISGGSFSVSPSSASVYTITGSDGACPASNTVMSTVNVNISDVISASGSSVCAGSQVVISPGGSNNYTITGGAFTVTPGVTTSYSVTGTSANGCPAIEAVVEITVSPSPTLSATSPVVCAGNSVAIVPSGADTYTISGGNFTVSPASDATYSITGISSLGCAASNTAVVNVTVSAIPLLSVNNATICSGMQAVLTPSGAATYSITGGSFSVSPAANASYTITGTSAQGCAAAVAAVASISVNITPTVSAYGGMNLTCPGDHTVQFYGASTYTMANSSSYSVFTSSSPSTLFSYVLNLPATYPSGYTDTYSVTGSSAEGCLSDLSADGSTIHFGVNPKPVIAVNSGSICSGDIFTVSATGNQMSSFTLTGGSYTAGSSGYSGASYVVNPSITTSYSVSGTAIWGCISDPVISTVVVNTPTISVNSATICSGMSVVITPTGAATYSITGNSFTVSPIANTSYSVSASNAGCPSNTVVASVSVNITPTLTANSASICSGGSVIITPTGNAATYSITNSNFTVSPTATSSYTVYGDLNGCTNSVVSTVSVNPTPTLSVNSATICSGTSVAITPTGAATYSITGNNFTVSPIANASYSVSGTSTAGCLSNTVVASVSVNITPTLTANSASICSGGSVIITPTGNAATYSITNNNFTVSPIATSSYTVYGGSNGCTNSVVSTVSVSTTPTITVNSASICAGASVVITPTGAATYSITGNAYTVTPGGNTSYLVTGASTAGCVSAPAVSHITVSPVPTIAVNSATICSGNSAVITPSGAVTYSITGNTFTVTPTASASYSVTGTNTAGCVSATVAIAQVVVNSTPTVSVSGNITICNGETAILTASGAGTYSWSTNAQTNTVSLSPASNTTYTVTGASGNCNNAVVVSLSVNPLPTLTVNNPTVCSGILTIITPSGASTYSISGGSFSVAPAATTAYSITGTDVNGCVSSQVTSTITVNASPTITANSPSVCAGNTAVITPSGADTYIISGGVFTVSPTATTVYSLTGIDVNGCLSASITTTVMAYALPTITAVSSASYLCVGETATLTAGGAVNYSWSSAETGSSVVAPATVAGSVTYTVVGADANGCVNTTTLTQRADDCTGISKQSEALAFGLYPNPNNGQFVVEAKQNVTLIVMNALGQVVYSETTTADTTTISIRHLDNGIYFVKAIDGASQRTVKLIKE